MNILFIGDIFGKPGRQIIKENLKDIREELKIDLCIANCENLASGRGITPKTATEMFQNGVDLFTSGNHLWDKKDGLEFIEKESRIAKPLNYPSLAVGSKYVKTTVKKKEVVVLTLIGQAFLPSANSPFEAFNEIYNEISEISKIIIVDFHAEATAEKRAMGFFLNGRASAVLGTHTHIQTAYEEILNRGTAYITDVGMTGPHDSVIGVKKDIIILKMLTGMPQKYIISGKGLQLNAVFVEINESNGKAERIYRIRRKYL